MVMTSEQVRILKEMALTNLKLLLQNLPSEISDMESVRLTQSG
jgi:hypothetical protein